MYVVSTYHYTFPLLRRHCGINQSTYMEPRWPPSFNSTLVAIALRTENKKVNRNLDTNTLRYYCLLIVGVPWSLPLLNTAEVGFRLYGYLGAPITHHSSLSGCPPIASLGGHWIWTHQCSLGEWSWIGDWCQNQYNNLLFTVVSSGSYWPVSDFICWQMYWFVFMFCVWGAQQSAEIFHSKTYRLRSDSATITSNCHTHTGE